MAEAERLNHGNSYTVYPAIVARDIERDSPLVYFICPELMPHSLTGDLAPGKQAATVSTLGRNGQTINTQITSANYLEATWEGQDFVRYPPMVRKGEQIEVYRRANQDKWTWRSTAFGRMTRTTDRLCFEVSASGTNTEASKTDNATYSVEFNSIDQTIDIRTSNANGEATPFRFGADLKKGIWFATDNQDINEDETSNRVFMDTGVVSGNPTYQINLNTGIMLRFLKKDMELKIPGKALINISDRCIVGSPLFIVNPDTAGAVIGNFTSIGLKIATDFVADIGNVFGINAKSAKFAGPVIASGFRGAQFMYGLVNATYKAMTVSNANVGSPISPSNSADTDTSGNGDKALIAASAVVAAFKQVVTGLSSCMKYDGSADAAPDTAQDGTINSHKGQ